MAPKIPPTLIHILKSPRSPHKIHLIGTLHGTSRSRDDVHDLIEKVKPHVVFLECCNSRRSVYDYGRSVYDDQYSSFGAKLRTFFSNAFCAKSELRAAYEAAQLCGARIVLGDRDYRVTHKRVHGLNQKAPRTYGSRESLYDFLHKEHALLDYLIGMGEKNPWGAESFVFERDLYITNELVLTIKRIEGDEPKDVVAIVGCGHVPGIVERWNNEMKHPGSELDNRRLMEINRTPIYISPHASEKEKDKLVNHLDKFISEEDFKSYISSRKEPTAKRLARMRIERDRLKLEYEARRATETGSEGPPSA